MTAPLKSPPHSAPGVALRHLRARAACCALLVLLGGVAAQAELRAGSVPARPPAAEAASSSPVDVARPRDLVSPALPPDGPGLYAGVKDRNGCAVSWVRINGLKDRGEMVPALRVRWGKGNVDLPLVDMSAMELHYSGGHTQATVRLLSGEVLRTELLNPYTELQGWWRQNPYSIALADIRQVWFQYVPATPEQADRYVGPPRRRVVEGFVRAVELGAASGVLRLTTSRGEALELPWRAAGMAQGLPLLTSRVAYLPGRVVRAVYTLSAGMQGRAERQLVELRLVRAQATP